MSWNYGGDPQNDDIDAVRLLIGDTNENDPQLQDEEIEYFLSLESSVAAAAGAAAHAMSARFARLVSKSVGKLRIDYAERSKQWALLAEYIAARADSGAVSVGPAMATEADKEADDLDDTYRNSSFRVGMHDSRSGNERLGQPL